VRVQCFHYLLPHANNYSCLVGGVDSQEPDPKVLELSRVLISIDEAMNSSLQPRKLKVCILSLKLKDFLLSLVPSSPYVIHA
jgi:hypothetical protein